MALTALDLNADLTTSAEAKDAIPILTAYVDLAKCLFERRRYSEAGMTEPAELTQRIADIMASGDLPTAAYRGTNVSPSASISPSESPSVSASKSPSVSPSKSPSVSPSVSPSISPSPSS